jgi:hypothetical protein
VGRIPTAEYVWHLMAIDPKDAPHDAGGMNGARHGTYKGRDRESHEFARRNGCGKMAGR